MKFACDYYEEVVSCKSLAAKYFLTGGDLLCRCEFHSDLTDWSKFFIIEEISYNDALVYYIMWV